MESEHLLLIFVISIYAVSSLELASPPNAYPTSIPSHASPPSAAPPEYTLEPNSYRTPPFFPSTEVTSSSDPTEPSATGGPTVETTSTTEGITISDIATDAVSELSTESPTETATAQTTASSDVGTTVVDEQFATTAPIIPDAKVPTDAYPTAPSSALNYNGPAILDTSNLPLGNSALHVRNLEDFNISVSD